MEPLPDSARHLQGLDDRELQRILALSRADYTPEAIAIAEAELKRRSLAALTAEEYWQRFPEERITSTADVKTLLDFPWGKLIFGAVLVWVAYHLHGVFTELETGARVSARMHWILAELYRNLGHRITVGIVALGGGLSLLLGLRQLVMRPGRRKAAHVIAAAGCLIFGGICAAALVWLTSAFFYAPSQSDLGGQPSTPHPRQGATPVSPQAVASAAVAPLVEGRIHLEVSTKYSAIHHAYVGTLPPDGSNEARLFQTSDRYTAEVRTKNGPVRVMLFDPAKMRAGADEGVLVLETRVDDEATIDLPEVTAPEGNVLVVLNQNRRPVDVTILVFRRGDRPVATADTFKQWLQIPIDVVQKFYRVPSFRVSVEPCGVATAFSTASRGDIVVCTELIADLEKHKADLALHPILLHELAHSLLLLWGLPGYDNEDVADEFATVLTARASPDAMAEFIAWLESQDSLTEAVVQLVNGDRHTISVQRARNMRAALKDTAELQKRWGKLLAPYARLPIPNP